MDKNNLLPVVVIVAILAVGGLLLVNSRNQPVSTTATVTPTATAAPQNTMIQEESTDSVSGSIKTFQVVGTPFAFDLKEIRVNEGDVVQIVFNNTEGFHDWVLDEFNAKTKQLQVGETDTIQFVANKKGTFEYYCSVGNHRQQGMVGNLIVE